MFGHLLGPRSFDNPKILLARKQTFVRITFGGISFIPMATMALATYLGSWAFIASIIAMRFMITECPFLLEALARIDNNTFLF
jgi:hypothetical protein